MATDAESYKICSIWLARPCLHCKVLLKILCDEWVSSLLLHILCWEERFSHVKLLLGINSPRIILIHTQIDGFSNSFEFSTILPLFSRNQKKVDLKRATPWKALELSLGKASKVDTFIRLHTCNFPQFARLFMLSDQSVFTTVKGDVQWSFLQPLKVLRRERP